jgi:hypothetical protein
MLDPKSPLTGPSAAYQEQVAVFHHVVVEVTRRRSDVVPSLMEHLQDDVLIHSGGTQRAALGWHWSDVWQHDGRFIDEIFINADRRHGHGTNRAEDVAVTLIHEAAHADNHLRGVQGCSNRGRYHNRKFAEVAVALGLSVIRDPRYGHRTPSLQPSAREEYADLLEELEAVLILTREPEMVYRPKGTLAAVTSVSTTLTTNETEAKYIFASCKCRTARGGLVTFRMAKGSWRTGTVWCSVCGCPFETDSESLTTAG